MAPTRIEIGSIDLLTDGTMKEIPFPTPESESKILLSKVKGTYYATSPKCTHYGAALVKGVLTAEGKVVCPWHGAGFNVCTGDIEDSPGLGSLQSYKVEVDANSVYVIPPTDSAVLTQFRQPPALASSLAKDAPTGVLIIGSGAASAHAIEGLREEGYEGKIKVVTKEQGRPVDRTKLSKMLVKSGEGKKVELRDGEYYEKRGVEFVFGTEAKEIKFEQKTVVLADGTEEKYENLIVATGSIANRIPVQGHGLDNIFVLRDLVDSAAIDEALGADAEVKKNVVIVGSSFIGMEVALTAAKRAKVTVVGMEDAPFTAILGPAIGNGIRKFHESQGITFHLGASLDHFEPSKTTPSAIGSVLLKDGTVLPADLVILGVGVKPATALMKASGLELEKDGGVRVDDHLRVLSNGGDVHKGVFAVGDIASWVDGKSGIRQRVEHWNVAANHARNVAKTIAGKPTAHGFDKVPVFWSAQGQQLRYAGSAKAKEWDDVIVQGNPDELKFVAYYLKGDEVVAAASMQNDPIVAHVSELFALGKMISGRDIRGGQSPFGVALA